MNCRKHSGDSSRDVGVCASCLRERLCILIEKQAQGEADAEHEHEEKECQDTYVRQPSEAPAVSTWHQKSSSLSDRPIHPHRQRHSFFSTPQVGPTFSSNPVDERSEFLLEKKTSSRFSLSRFIFRNGSEKIRDTVPPNLNPTSQPSPSSSIFSLWKNKKKKKQSRASSVTDSGVSVSACRRKSAVVSNRGMSPCGESDDEEVRNGDRSSLRSSYSSDACPHSWKRTPAPLIASTTVRRTTTTPHPRNLPGFAFCLSPMVRASPSRNRKKNGCKTAEVGFAGDIRVVPANGRHHSDEASFCKNRSKKLADIGREAYHC